MNACAPFKVSVCGIPELTGHCDTGISHVLSILDPDCPTPDVLGTFGEHTRLELRFHDIIDANDADMIAPQRAHVADILAFGRRVVEESGTDTHFLVHCHAGVSRSTASMALILAQALPHTPAGQIFDEVLRIRPQAWPNLRILEFGDAELGRHGELVTAAVRLYRAQLDRSPHLAAQMRSGGRGREVAAAMR